MKEKKAGVLSFDLLAALGMSDQTSTPPPWLINMQVGLMTSIIRYQHFNCLLFFDLSLSCLTDFHLHHVSLSHDKLCTTLHDIQHSATAPHLPIPACAYLVSMRPSLKEPLSGTNLVGGANHQLTSTDDPCTETCSESHRAMRRRSWSIAPPGGVN